jgi:hypothetical protein
VEEKYREDLPDDLRAKVQQGLQHIDLDVFLPSLHECILFKITLKQDANMEDYVDNTSQPLNYVLDEYLEGKGVSRAIPALTDGRFPVDVQLKHSINTWLLAQNALHKQNVR